MSKIGERMRELRGPSSLREMAEAIGIKYNAWARYEAGGSLPGAEIIEKICRVHSCSADWLLGLKDTNDASAVKTQQPMVNLEKLRKTATKLVKESSTLAGTIKELKTML